MGSASPTDLAGFFFCSPDAEDTWVAFPVGLRGDKAYDFKFEENNFSGYDVHTWMFFMREDGSDRSDSVYTGVVKVA